MNLKQISQLVIATALAGAGMSAQAYSSWVYGTGGGADTAYTCNNSNNACSTTSAAANQMTTTGVYAQNATVGTFSPTNTGGAKSSGITGSWSEGTLTAYPGVGMTTNEVNGGTEPNHALDNAGTYTEGVLLSFATKTILTGVDLSWKSTDADISVWAYTGAGSPASLVGTGASKSAMEAAGWSLVGNYADLSTDTAVPYAYNLINGASGNAVPTASANSVSSSWWLITAFNSSYGSGANLTQGDDYFKLLAVSGTACTGLTTNGCGTTSRVPEPASLALVSLGLVGVVGLRRRHRKQAT